MNLIEFLQDLSLKGVKLWTDGGKLRTGGSQEVLTTDVIAKLKQYKSEILHLLKENPDILGVYPLSYGQKGLWFLWQLSPQSHNYNVSFSIRIYSKVDITIWQQVFQTLRERHPLLRSTFPNLGEQPIQQIHQHQELDFLQIDASSWSEEELKKKVVAAHRYPFNLQTEPVMRVRWFTCSEANHIMLLTVHHIALDGWSCNLIAQELPQLYESQLNGLEVSLPPLRYSYQDYVSWKQELVEGPEGEQLWSYWQQKLGGELPVLDLPTDRPRPPIQTDNGGSYSFKLSQKLTEQLKELAKTESATLYMTLLAAFQVLLSRYTGQEDILVGSPTYGGRSKEEFASIVGYFVDSVVMRADLSGSLSFRDFLSQVRQTVLGALAHQDYPFALLVEKLKVERDFSRSPLFQASFVLQKFLESQDQQKVFFSMEKTLRKWVGLEVEAFLLDQYESQYDLLLEMFGEDSSLVGFLKYNADLFDEQTIARMVGHFQNLLEGIVNDPQQRVTVLPLMKEPELEQILVEWNNTKTDYPKDKCIHQLFEEQVENNPEAVAVVFEEQKLTYYQLNSKANQLAHHLQTLGVKPETLVGICVQRSVEMVVGILAILKAGGAYVPLDPSYPSERLAYMLADSEVLVLLTTLAQMKLMPEHQAQLVCWEQDGEAISSQSIENPLSGVNHQNLAYVIYTSGSTGKPKGAMNTHGGICNRLLWMQDAFGLTPSDKILQKTPFSFDVSVWEFFWPLLVGATLVVAKPEGHKDSGYLRDLIAQEQITTLHFVPSMLKVFLQEDKLEDCSSLKRVICSGEALSVQLQEKFFEKLGCELHNLYGPTEAAIDVTWWPCVPDQQQKIIPIGRPIANTQMYILDQYQQPVPIGVAGELHIAGAGLARGYLKQEELTQQKFIPNPFDKSQDTEKSKLYKTGDLARYLPDGNIEFLGRIDHQVKMRGFRIELGEIESAIEEHPGVEQTVVTLRENQAGQQQLVAYIVPNHQGSKQVKQLLQWEQEGRLKTGSQPETVITPTVESGAALSVQQIETYLREQEPESVCFSGLVNSRVANDVELVELLSQPESKENVQQLRGKLESKETKSIDPERLYELSASCGYSLELCWSAQGSPELMDGVFVRSGLAQEGIVLTPLTQKSLVAGNWENYGNNPLSSQLRKELIPKLREYLESRLPEYMVPSGLMVLSQLPLTPNGKVDRKALPIPDMASSVLAEYVAPETETEKLLSEIWREVLGIEKVGIHDNFFEVGGDSIISIQIVARAQEAGIQLTTKQLFQNQTIAEQAAVAGVLTNVQHQQGIVTGEIPLTPIQHWFFEQNLQQMYHFNQSMLLSVSPQIEPDLLFQVVEKILEHHDALRLRYHKTSNYWQQINSGLSERIPFQVVDLSKFSENEQLSLLEETATRQQASLNLTDGPIMGVVLFNLGNQTEARLLIIIHHLAVDGVSWRILLEDLFEAYNQLSKGETIKLPRKTTAFQDWAVRLVEYGQSQKCQKELEYWLDQPWSGIVSLPMDYPEGQANNTMGNAVNVTGRLSQEETKALLQEVPSAYNTQINDVLLTALVVSLGDWIGTETVLIDLEGHGREELFADVDLSRTVGWFTSMFPVKLQLSSEDIGEALKSIKEQLRQIPERGIGYGILRYLSPDKNIRIQLAALPKAEISFNYLGQFNSSQFQKVVWQTTRDLTGPNQSIQGNRTHLLGINSLIAEGQLQIIWTYNSCIHKDTTIANLAEKYIQTLRNLIIYCQSPEVGGYTPSDFSTVDLTQEEIENIITEIDD